MNAFTPPNAANNGPFKANGHKANGHKANGHDSPNLHKYTSGHALYDWHLRQVMHALHDMVAHTAPRSVLDAGCGEGFVMRFLREQNAHWKLAGVDLSAAAIRYARSRSNGDTRYGDMRYAVGDVYDLPFDTGAFDTVLCSEVLEHLDAPGRALREVCRVARHAVVVSVPREPYFQWLNVLGQALGLSPDPGHVNFWNERGFRRFVRPHLDHPRIRTKHLYQMACGAPGLLS